MPSTTIATHLRLSDAAAIIGVHPETLRRWADAGKVRSFRTPGGQRRFDRTDVENLLTPSPMP
jgi:excisionase family DNA binding protein